MAIFVGDVWAALAKPVKVVVLGFKPLRCPTYGTCQWPEECLGKDCKKEPKQ